ncbi:hypothetical protein PINS_up002862 [Pythium insidiosum]|nr:hypothetical protein PINS_up002862 [Pythium insidiosum]
MILSTAVRFQCEPFSAMVAYMQCLYAEAAELFRNDPSQFANLVKRSLRGYSVNGISFEALIS